MSLRACDILPWEYVNLSFEGDWPEDPKFVEYIEARIQSAFVRLKFQCPVVRETLASPTVDEDYIAIVREVLLEAILRVARDPAPGYQSETESGYIYQKFPSEASANIWFRKEDLDNLGCGRGQRIGSLRIGTSRSMLAPAYNGCSRSGWW